MASLCDMSTQNSATMDRITATPAAAFSDVTPLIHEKQTISNEKEARSCESETDTEQSEPILARCSKVCSL